WPAATRRCRQLQSAPRRLRVGADHVGAKGAGLHFCIVAADPGPERRAAAVAAAVFRSGAAAGTTGNTGTATMKNLHPLRAAAAALLMSSLAVAAEPTPGAVELQWRVQPN